ncbi:MAG: hypothetical protein AAF447_28355, partial [Myxococcota bacterium]
GAVQAAPPPVVLDSEPAGAEVLEQGVIIGTTPLVLPRPSADALRELEVRLDAHEPRRVRVSAASATHVQVNLAVRRRRGRARTAPPDLAAGTMGEAAPRRPPPQAELLDPWSH